MKRRNPYRQSPSEYALAVAGCVFIAIASLAVVAVLLAPYFL